MGGLEDEEDRKPLFGPVDNEYHLFEKDEVRLLFPVNLNIDSKSYCAIADFVQFACKVYYTFLHFFTLSIVHLPLQLVCVCLRSSCLSTLTLCLMLWYGQPFP